MSDRPPTALLFPGQGSHEAGMLDVVAAETPELLALIRELVGTDPFERVADGTRFAQPAIFAASVAAWEAAGRPPARAIAGHSLGELAALVAGGVLGSADGARIAVLRGYLMQKAAEAAGEGGMLALLGDGEAARRLAGALGLRLANDNAPDQIVLTGRIPLLEKARRAARGEGLRAVRLPVQGAFHSPEMAPATRALATALAKVRFHRPHTPVLCAATASEFENPRLQLAEALVRPVRWRETMLALYSRGITSFAELGPGHVLSGLVERNPAPVRDLETAGA